jgi:hypothetical protein
MASAVYATAVGPGGVLHGGCQKPPTQVLRRLNDLALIDVSDVAELGPISQVHQLLPVNSRNEQLEKRRALELFRRVQKLSIGILGSIFTMHAYHNAFDGIDFGANEHGILVATLPRPRITCTLLSRGSCLTCQRWHMADSQTRNGTSLSAQSGRRYGAARQVSWPSTHAGH